ncbi:MAG: SRPBCC domain-containing protein [Cyclobacteriaceae bacterium]|nr:SRPBCC domain-containing protein [Cyclobacteriaceae bacterium HetDA_MAG_MS6]
MKTPSVIVNEVEIDASTKEVWKALVDPEKTKRYMFNCEVICSWQIGDPILWKGATDGIVYVKGNLRELVEDVCFEFSIFDPNAEYPEVPENYLYARYDLISSGAKTRLKVTQGDYNTVADGEKRYQDTMAQGGWQPVLDQIKKIVEVAISSD